MTRSLSSRLIALMSLPVLTLTLLLVPPSQAMIPINEAVVINSGSTNTIGYRIYVAPTGDVRAIDGRGSRQDKLPNRLKQRFFHDLKLAIPGSLQQTKRCGQSTSSRTSTIVVLGAQRSADLSCADSAKEKALVQDINNITRLLHVSNVRRGQGQELPTQNF